MRVRLYGPFWHADFNVVSTSSDQDQDPGLRTLFARRPFKNVAAEPGTQLMLGYPLEVHIELSPECQYVWERDESARTFSEQVDGDLEAGLKRGELSLILAAADPDRPPSSEDFTQGWRCLAGELPLHFPPIDDDEEDSSIDVEELYARLQLLPLPRPKSKTPAPGLPENTIWRPERAGPAALLADISVHASGLSILGKTKLPWQNEGEFVSGPFLLTYRIHGTGYQLGLEPERLTPGERQNMLQQWAAFRRMMSPGGAAASSAPPSQAGPHWVTLEIADTPQPPQVFWQLEFDFLPSTQEPEPPVLRFRSGESTPFSLRMTDRAPWDSPQTLARISLEELSIMLSSDNILHVHGNSGAGGQLSSGKLSYRAKFNSSDWSEGFKLDGEMENGLRCAFDPIETARMLRQTQSLPVPTWRRGKNSKTVDPAVLWAFVPLDDGWAQLPVPNLTEQIYLDAELDSKQKSPSQDTNSEPDVSTMEGAVLYGNEDSRVRENHPDEQPWSVTLTRFDELTAHWTLEPVANGDPYQLREIKVDLLGPELTLNGLLWISTEAPTTADALPALDNWTDGLRPISLRTVKNPDQAYFPSLVKLAFKTLEFSRRPIAGQPTSALLGNWSFSYDIDQKLVDTAIEGSILPSHVFETPAPWVWRRHPHLPMIQALPLTQNRNPPNHPSASRQLVPFRFQLGPDHDCRFGVVNGQGAARWPEFLSAGEGPADEWIAAADIPLAALSLPGVVLQTEGGLSTIDVELPLSFQYRFDVPATDEINALAQMPQVEQRKEEQRKKEPASAEKVAETQASPENEQTDKKDRKDKKETNDKQDESAQPLNRDAFAAHWIGLSEKASLAASDAVDAFDGDASMHNLIEPFTAHLKPDPTFVYPGTVFGQTTVDVLKGISGEFSLVGNQLSLSTDGKADFSLTAGSMAASAVNGGFRDQRGLQRRTGTVKGNLLSTPVELAVPKKAERTTPVTDQRKGEKQQGPDGKQELKYQLTSTLAAISVEVLGTKWQLWMRDVPARDAEPRVESDPNSQSKSKLVFDRDDVVSAFAEDVNDPEALSREHNYRSGYEWRLQDDQSDGTKSYLKFCNLDFYPLTLDHVLFAGDQVKEVRLTGRLQLPLKNSVETEDISNAVVVTLVENGEGLKLENIELAKSRDSDQQTIVGEWPLAAESADQTPTPRLRWSKIEYVKSPAPGLRIKGDLHYFLFDVEWIVPFDLLIAEQMKDKMEVVWTAKEDAEKQAFGKNTSTTRDDHNRSGPDHCALRPSGIELRLSPQPENHAHHAHVTLAASWGDPAVGELTADVTYDLLGSPIPRLDNVKLFGIGLKLDSGPASGSTAEAAKTIQFSWSAVEDKAAFLFPGMKLDGLDKHSPGFAAVTFDAKPVPAAGGGVIPELTIRSGFVEAILACRWLPPSNDSVFHSSHGDLVIGYTAEWCGERSEETVPKKPEWRPSFLVNGQLEITNLISWPLGATGEADSLFDHTRHTALVLLNQHQIPPGTVSKVNTGASILSLGRPWQFLAVVEHRLFGVSGESVAAGDRRFTTVQEVRLQEPAAFADFLDSCGNGRELPQEGGGQPPPVADTGYLVKRHRDLLSAHLRKLENLLIVEASAPHWIRKKPLGKISFTDLQYLPNGIQQAALSQPEDYSASDPRDPDWMLMTLPFLGRLQDAQLDVQSNQWDNPPQQKVPSPIHVDPIRCLKVRLKENPQDDSKDQQQDASRKELARLLASRRLSDARTELSVSALDTPLGRSFARLDPVSLDENWHRLRNPILEDAELSVGSVLYATPDTPAALSRSMALRRAFRAFRPLWEDADAIGKNYLANPGFDGGWHSVLPPVVGAIPNHWAVFRIANEFLPSAARTVPTGDGAPRRHNLPYLLVQRGDTDRYGYHGLHVFAESTYTEVEIGQDVQLGPGDYELSFDVLFQGTPSPACSSQVSLFCDTLSSKVRHAPRANYGKAKRVKVRFHLDADREVRVGIRLRGDMTKGCRGWLLNKPRLVRLASALAPVDDRGGVPRTELSGDTLTTDTLSGDSIVWRRDSLLLFDHRTNQGEVDVAGWHLVGSQIPELVAASTDDSRTSYYPAATLLPVHQHLEEWLNKVPVSFAVSPYSAINFQTPKVESDGLLTVLFAELLCLDDTLDSLRSVATTSLEVNHLKLSESQKKKREDAAFEKQLQAAFEKRKKAAFESSENWATSIHRRICPRSTLAILRYRQLKWHETNDKAPPVLTVSYRFDCSFGVRPEVAITKRVFSMRTAVNDLRYREGQFGGFRVPESLEHRTYELNPPLTVGVQPLYLSDQIPVAAVGFGGIGQKHAGVLRSANRPDEAFDLDRKDVDEWADQIRSRFGGQRVAVCLRESETTLIKTLAKYDFFMLYPLDAKLARRYRDDLKSKLAGDDAAGILKVFLKHREQLHARRPGESRQWPWGWSGLRVAVQYTKARVGVADGSEKPCLWWQTPSHVVQFRSAANSQRSAGLPSLFRARAISALLPVLPRPPLPTIPLPPATSDSASATQEAPAENGTLRAWQSILPGAYRYILLGNRPGAMFAIRNQVTRQPLPKREATPADVAHNAPVVSGSVPVQHRMPRPVALPANSAARADSALRTWASRAEVTDTVFVTRAPADEAFFAAGGGSPAQRVRVIMISPEHGIIRSDWDGRVTVRVQDNLVDAKPSSIKTEKRDFEVQAVDGDVDFKISKVWEGEFLTIRFEGVNHREPNAGKIVVQSLADYLGHKQPGTGITVNLKTGRPAGGKNDGFKLPLSLPLSFAGDNRRGAPLAPLFQQFEDPEYNRKLASTPASAFGMVGVMPISAANSEDRVYYRVTLASDRTEYNPDSPIAFRWDWEVVEPDELKAKAAASGTEEDNANRLSAQTATLELHRVDENGLESKVDAGIATAELLPDRLHQLIGVASGLNPGDILRMTLLVNSKGRVKKASPIVLSLRIVAEPVIPAPEAGYALLRRLNQSASADPATGDGAAEARKAESKPVVDCARFAWGPLSDRVDLVCADDLKAGVVRRRGIFKWIDVSRIGSVKGYCIQKLTKGGSTHFPDLTQDFCSVDAHPEFGDQGQQPGGNEQGSPAASLSRQPGEIQPEFATSSDDPVESEPPNSDPGMARPDPAAVQIVAPRPAGAFDVKSGSDNLKFIEGIGPRIAQVLASAGITSFEQLAQQPVEKLKPILAAARISLKLHSPDTWPVQARLAASGQWDELREFKERM